MAYFGEFPWEFPREFPREFPWGQTDVKRGRKPKPTAQLKLAGTFRADRHSEDEPAPAAESNRPGLKLSPRAARRFALLAPLLREQCVLSELDKGALACYCEAFARWYDARNAIETNGTFYTAASGNVLKHPAVSIMEAAASEMQRWSAELGLTPSSRARIPNHKRKTTPEEKLAALIGE